jgi:hypothetical protein
VIEGASDVIEGASDVIEGASDVIEGASDSIDSCLRSSIRFDQDRSKKTVENFRGCT